MVFSIFLTLSVFILGPCQGETGNYKHYRLESLCKSDSAKVRLRLGNTAATFSLNSSLVPGALFNCHLELALDSSKLGFFVYFEDLQLTRSQDCDQDYVQFGRDILFITSYRSEKFCDRIQGSFPTLQNKTSNFKLPPSVTPLAKRTYTETTDQEMDVWVKLRLHSPSITTIKTVSFVVTPVLRSCKGHDVGYRKCGGKESYCVREQFFCDGQVNCATRHAVISPDELDCKMSATPLADLDKAEWSGDTLYIIIGPGLGVLIILLFVIVVYRKFPAVLNLPNTKYSSDPPAQAPDPLSSRHGRSAGYEYHTGHIVPVPLRPAPSPPTSATAPPLPRCPPPYSA